MTAIEEMAGMDVLCSDKTGTLTLNKLTVDKNLIEVLLACSDKWLFPGSRIAVTFLNERYLVHRFLRKEWMQILSS